MNKVFKIDQFEEARANGTEQRRQEGAPLNLLQVNVKHYQLNQWHKTMDNSWQYNIQSTWKQHDIESMNFLGTTISVEQAQRLTSRTAGSNEYIQNRKKRVQATDMGAILGYPGQLDIAKVFYNKTNPSMKYKRQCGQLMDMEAAATFYLKHCKPKNLRLAVTGMHVDPNFPVLGCAPDRMIVQSDAADDQKPVGLFEYVLLPDVAQLPVEPQDADVAACIAYMGVTGIHRISLMYYNVRDHIVFNLEYDQQYQKVFEETIVPAAKQFLSNILNPGLSDIGSELMLRFLEKEQQDHPAPLVTSRKLAYQASKDTSDNVMKNADLSALRQLEARRDTTTAAACGARGAPTFAPFHGAPRAHGRVQRSARALRSMNSVRVVQGGGRPLGCGVGR